MENSHISWTTHTFNPWEGCTMWSPGCFNCYALARNKRFAGGANWGKGAPRRRTKPDNWKGPLRWNLDAGADGAADWYDGKPIIRPRVFCASLADWLDDEVPIDWLADLLRLIWQTPNLDWLLLTKRPENWRERIELAALHYSNVEDDGVCAMLQSWLFAGRARTLGTYAPPANVWLGTTVEDRPRKARMDVLRNIPAVVHFLSCEPLLEDLGSMDFTGIDWVIVGGESGPGARPMEVDWALELRDQCAASDVAFHFKQWGGPDSKARGRLLDGALHDALPRLSNTELTGL